MSKRSSGGGWVIAAIALLVIAGAAYFLAQRARQADTKPASSVAPAASSPAPASTAPAIAHPIAQADSGPTPASTAPLPALADSDANVADSLIALAKGGDIGAWLVRQSIIPRIVATVDALPHSDMGRFILPVKPAKGSLQMEQANGQSVIGAANAARYAPYMQAMAGVDSQALVDWYVHYYPLFQQAYVELGYPRAYFNDRLIAVIDHLLAAPEPTQPLIVAPYKQAYAFADPALQGLSVGQKAMVRIGPANEAAVKAKLRDVRARLVGSGLHAAPAAATSAAR
ncbi:DUF3014 domain-containing protein [Dyella ginsengisoli]|uniref:DUF3014 domain-containing protein n=1 Tax=Dyella ginsengisoli TaxID=363848 RepID=A0ABW8JZ49_9GAMM